MRRACLLLLLLFVFRGFAAAAEWPGAAFSKVRAYYYNAASAHDRRLIDRSGRLDASVTNPAGVELTPTQTARLLQLIRRGSKPQPVTSCYVPHHGFVFSDALGRRVAVFEFCLECLKSTPTPNTVGPFFDYPALADLLHELELPIGPKFRTSKEYRRFHARRLREG